MRYTGPRNRIARRNGVDLELKTFGSKNHGKLMRKLSIPPGETGANKKRRKTSEHGSQLREKQKLRYMFGINERQLSNYFTEAKRAKGNTGKLLVETLESRLDNVVYRAGFAPTRAAARQLVNHGHVTVNGKMLSIPSYRTSVGQTISFAHEATAKIPAVDASLSRTDIIAPEWVKREGIKAQIVLKPSATTVEKLVNLRLIIEFYSK